FVYRAAPPRHPHSFPTRRSSDLRGVRGFAEQSPAFQQPDPANTTNPPAGVLLPFHLDTSKTNAACTHDITHDWVPQHQSWDSGAMDGFVTSRLATNSNDE